MRQVSNVNAQSSNETRSSDDKKEVLDMWSFVIDLTFGF
jgi:hypothetical protein